MTKRAFPNAETIHKTQLANGITVLVYENFASPSVVVDGGLYAGGLSETRKNAGIADFAAAALMRGTQNVSFEQIYERLESVGASLSFGSGNLITDFGGSALAEDLPLVLDVLQDTLRRPLFSAEHVDKLRGEALTGLQMAANNTRARAARAFRENAYRGHPYSISKNGYPESIAAVTSEQLRQFHHSAYSPLGMVVTIVGAVKAADAVAMVADALGDWQNDDYVVLGAIPDMARPSQMIRVDVDMPEKTQSDVVLGLPGPRRSAPDYLDARLANTILGVFGMMGRLGQKVRVEQGLAYYAYSQLNGGLGPGSWRAATGVAPEKVELAIESIRSEIRRFQNEPIPENEVADSIAYVTGSLPMGLETNSGIAGTITDIYHYGLGFDYLQNYTEIMRAITPERVQAAARKYFSADEIVIAVAGPKQS